MTGRGLDPAAVARGAGADLAVLAPVIAAYSGLHGTGAIRGDSGVIVTAVVAVLVAPAVGGAVAARRGPDVPLTNAAAASGAAVLVYVAFRIADAVVRSRPLPVGSVVIVIMVSVLLGVLGGLAGARARRPGADPDGAGPDAGRLGP